MITNKDATIFTLEELTLQIDDFAEKVLKPIINRMADDLRKKMKGKSKSQKKKIMQSYLSERGMS